MIALSEVENALRPWLGTQFLSSLPDLSVRAAQRLNGYGLGGDLVRLAQGLDSLLFLSVRDATGGKMCVRLDDGALMRVRVSDFTLMADDLMYLLFADMPRDAAHALAVRDYSMRHESLAALRALVTRFAPMQSQAELYALHRIIRGYPPYRWRSWLP